MGRKLDLGLRESILTLVSLKYSSRKIVEALKVRNIVVSQKAVSNLIRKNINKEAGSDTAPSLVKPRGSPKLRTPGLVAAIEKDLSGPNPLTRSALSLKYGVSATTIARVISQDLEGKVRKKCRVHALSNKQAKQRLDRGPRFLRYINGRKWKNVITIDEAWVYLTDVNGIRKIYYEFRGERSPESWTKFWKESHPKGVMFVAGVCSRGKTAIRFVKPGAKINSEYYIQHVLKPLFKNDIRKLFPGELINKVVFHHDSAPAHSSGITQEWLRNSGIKFIPKEHWMGNSPDLAPMDFCVNGLFKWKLFDHAATTVAGLKQVMRKVWSNLDQSKINNALRSWPKRVKLMIERQGLQIEHVLKNSK